MSPDPLRASGLMGPPSPSGGPETRRRGRPAWSGALGPRVGHVCPEGMRRDLISEGGCQCFGAPCCVPTWLWAHGSWKRRSPPAPAQEAGLVLLVLLLLLGRKGWGAQRVGGAEGGGPGWVWAARSPTRFWSSFLGRGPHPAERPASP